MRTLLSSSIKSSPSRTDVSLKEKTWHFRTKVAFRKCSQFQSFKQCNNCNKKPKSGSLGFQNIVLTRLQVWRHRRLHILVFCIFHQIPRRFFDINFLAAHPLCIPKLQLHDAEYCIPVVKFKQTVNIWAAWCMHPKPLECPAPWYHKRRSFDFYWSTVHRLDNHRIWVKGWCLQMTGHPLSVWPGRLSSRFLPVIPVQW